MVSPKQGSDLGTLCQGDLLLDCAPCRDPQVLFGHQPPRSKPSVTSKEPGQPLHPAPAKQLLIPGHGSDHLELLAQTLVTCMTSRFGCFLALLLSSGMRFCSGGATGRAPSVSARRHCCSFFCRAQKPPPMKSAPETRKKLDMQKT